MRKLTVLFAILMSVVPFVASAESASGEIKPAPWSGDWWARKKGLLVKGWQGNTPSAFAKYDEYAKGRTGRNPGAQDWEANVKNGHYNPNAENWEGHCNGWSAASILTPEPVKPHNANGIVFSTADQKGLLSELYMNCYCNFYGNRNWGKSGDDPDDIYPDEFHRLLIDYIGSGKSAIVCDISYDRMVWNYPLYKFESSWTTGWFNDRKLKVTTDCWFVDDGVPPTYIGCKWFKIRYTYNLYLDEHDNIVSGEWTGSSRTNHPDFVWVPTGDATVPANSTLENPRLDPKLVKEICNGNGSRAATRTPDMSIQEAGLNPEDLF